MNLFKSSGQHHRGRSKSGKPISISCYQYFLGQENGYNEGDGGEGRRLAMRLGAISLPAAYLYTALFQTRATPSQNSKHAIQHFFKIILELWIYNLPVQKRPILWSDSLEGLPPTPAYGPCFVNFFKGHFLSVLEPICYVQARKNNKIAHVCLFV